MEGYFRYLGWAGVLECVSEGEEIMLDWTIVYLFGILSSRAQLAFKLHEIVKTFMIHALIRLNAFIKEKY